ncbi:NAD-dependent epimerase/dehydratase family protein [Caulobacter sp.]|uniref:NAD-dependent epimerase/dehydratase family protein n=1 Tax=Caulobacter sp. TaxID=78 RepID=UPI002B493AD2|nr:NAD-dependent epimerase/dehydratase family protein [Caulobacter sp.]HJV40052.1 NAD-dependent epimerase/dehydratase family protein [Caulobacter sp.]
MRWPTLHEAPAMLTGFDGSIGADRQQSAPFVNLDKKRQPADRPGSAAKLEPRGVALVTGGSSYVAGWTIIALLQAGYRVRATLGSLAQEAEVRTALGRHVRTEDRLFFVAVDPSSDAGWSQAMSGADYVLHIASPLQGVRSARHMIAAARADTVRILATAREAGVRRVVMTSSVEAARPSRLVNDVLYADERVWTNAWNVTLGPHIRARTLGEREAWAFMAQSKGSMSLTTLLPSLVLGPVLGGQDHESLEVVARLLRGQVSSLPKVGFSIVDVRDLADLYIRAMVHPEAGGQRFIATGAFLWLDYMASLLRADLASHAKRVPRRKASSLATYCAALFKPHLRPLLRELYRQPHYSNDKALRVLGWRARRSSQILIDCGQSLIHHGLV